MSHQKDPKDPLGTQPKTPAGSYPGPNTDLAALKAFGKAVEAVAGDKAAIGQLADAYCKAHATETEGLDFAYRLRNATTGDAVRDILTEIEAK